MGHTKAKPIMIRGKSLQVLIVTFPYNFDPVRKIESIISKLLAIKGQLTRGKEPAPDFGQNQNNERITLQKYKRND